MHWPLSYRSRVSRRKAVAVRRRKVLPPRERVCGGSAAVTASKAATSECTLVERVCRASPRVPMGVQTRRGGALEVTSRAPAPRRLVGQRPPITRSPPKRLRGAFEKRPARGSASPDRAPRTPLGLPRRALAPWDGTDALPGTCRDAGCWQDVCVGSLRGDRGVSQGWASSRTSQRSAGGEERSSTTTPAPTSSTHSSTFFSCAITPRRSLTKAAPLASASETVPGPGLPITMSVRRMWSRTCAPRRRVTRSGRGKGCHASLGVGQVRCPPRDAPHRALVQVSVCVIESSSLQCG